MPQQNSPAPESSSGDEAFDKACKQLGLPVLLQRMAKGDEQALTEFHRVTADRLFSMALRILDDRATAADALQDCMIRVWRTAGRYDSKRGDAFTWIAMILHGICIDHLRKQSRHSTRMARLQMEKSEAQSEGRCGLEDLFFRETIALVRDGLDQLTREERECIEIALFSPDTTHEAAERIGLAPGTLKVRTHRAMKRLRNLLGSTLPSES